MYRPITYFWEQYNLAAKCLPVVAEEKCFALKGGTAINLFYWDLPRISVDIDLIYLPIQNRKTSLEQIDQALRRIGHKITSNFGFDVSMKCLPEGGSAIKLDVKGPDAIVRIELSPVLRGCVYPPNLLNAKPRVESEHGQIGMTVASGPDVFAGKFLAALDRQHPRDLYDVHHFLKHSKVTDYVRTAFMVYLISHNRPSFDVLAPNHKELGESYENQLESMMIDHATLDELKQARIDLKRTIVDDMPDSHKEFLMGFLSGEPDWSLLDVPNVETMPGVQWRMINLERISDDKRCELLNRVESALNMNNALDMDSVPSLTFM